MSLADCRSYADGPQTRRDRCVSRRLSVLHRRTADPARPVCLLQTVGLAPMDRRPGETGVSLADCRSYAEGPQTRRDRCVSRRLSANRRYLGRVLCGLMYRYDAAQAEACLQEIYRSQAEGMRSPPNQACLQETHRSQAEGMRSGQWKRVCKRHTGLKPKECGPSNGSVSARDTPASSRRNAVRATQR